MAPDFEMFGKIKIMRMVSFFSGGSQVKRPRKVYGSFWTPWASMCMDSAGLRKLRRASVSERVFWHSELKQGQSHGGVKSERAWEIDLG